ncbi:MAG: recombinase zinc beta ribbon domain-containing protein, partial [Firmicutes bacterium]|nr:recombinase zinc beta ribbon domain-containing protein [Bacillota bacterium]
IGTLVQGKTTTPNYKIKKRFVKPEDEWIVIENNHEAIISKERFDIVNGLFRYDTKTPPGKEKVYLFSGKLFCSDCGGNLVRKRVFRNGREYVYYTCATKLKDKNKCTSHRINEKELAECVVISIRSHIDRTCDIRTALDIVSKLKLKPSEIELANEEIGNTEKLLEDYKSHKSALAESCAKGLINKNDYNDFSRIYDEKISLAEHRIVELKNNIKKLLKSNEEKNSWMDEFINYGNIAELNRNAVVVFIEKIIVHEGNKIEIIFNHRDEFDAVFSFLKNSYDVMLERSNL